MHDIFLVFALVHTQHAESEYTYYLSDSIPFKERTGLFAQPE